MLALTVVPILFALISQFNHRIIDVATEVRTTESRVYSLVQSSMSAIRLTRLRLRPTRRVEYRFHSGGLGSLHRRIPNDGQMQLGSPSCS
jgi:hypothetical protein